MLVATMKNENSGVPAKLRTYAPIRATRIATDCHPANGGGHTVALASDTLDRAKVEYGYFIGGLMEPITFPLGSRTSVYAGALAAIYSEWGEGRYAGFWEKDGTVYAEAVHWTPNREAALNVGRSLGQDVIYDIAAGQDIVL